MQIRQSTRQRQNVKGENETERTEGTKRGYSTKEQDAEIQRTKDRRKKDRKEQNEVSVDTADWTADSLYNTCAATDTSPSYLNI